MLRDILEGQGNANVYKELLKNLKNFNSLYGWWGDEMQRQLWRLQDLENGDGFGFTVELFLPCPRSAISIKGIPLCTIHGHISGHYV